MSGAHEFREFVDFLQHLWATLAGVSVLFPLSNTLFRVIPVARVTDGGFAYLSPAVVTAVATLASLFVVLWTFGQRDQMRVPQALNALQRSSLRSFVLGVAALLIYLAGHYAISQDFYFRVLGWESADLRRMAGDIILVLAYAGFFACVTRAFVALGLREYLSAGVQRQP